MTKAKRVVGPRQAHPLTTHSPPFPREEILETGVAPHHADWRGIWLLWISMEGDHRDRLPLVDG